MVLLVNLCLTVKKYLHLNLVIYMEYDKFHEGVESSTSDSGGSVFESSSSIPEHVKQEELSDLIRDLNLSIKAAEILVSRLQNKNCLRTGALILPYKRKRITFVLSKEELV